LAICRLQSFIAKDVILAGVRSVTLFDPEPAALADLSAQFFLSPANIGHRRDHSCRAELAELNEYVPVSVLEGPNSVAALDVEVISRFQVVVVIDQPLAYQLAINAITHPRNIAFISAETHGLFGGVFCDFGSGFVVSDATGEPPLLGMISGVSRDGEGIVTCLEETRHGLEDGDYVTFKEVKGMKELNGCLPRKVKVLGPYTFGIGDTTSFGEYQTGSGVFEQVKQPKVLNFLALNESLPQPEFVTSDWAKMDRQQTIHVGFQALSTFMEKTGSLPRPRNQSDAEELVKLAKEIDLAVDEVLIKEIAFGSQGYLAPMAAFLGGLVAQEVLKACSGKFHPIKQNFYFDALECLGPKAFESLTEEECAPIGSRYDSQIAVFGRKFQERLGSLKGFIVGAGAIGCELVKLFALLGVGAGPEGRVEITDMDTIEKSNLNRQFLFRPHHVGKSKSTTAAEAAIAINPEMKGKFCARMDRVGVETEGVFGDSFFESLDFVTNALDNMEARKYMDRRCVFYRKPLLESGTLGTKGNTQVVVPHLTESYSSSQDPPEKTIPFCTLHNFPNTIEHTIQWAMDQFHGLFRADPESANLFLNNPVDFKNSLLQPGQGHKDRLERVLHVLVSERPLGFEQCVEWARLKFEEFFSNNIQQLLFNFPRDAVTSTGALFWSGPKRAPVPLVFSAEDPIHMSFIMTAANLRAENFGLRGSRDVAVIKKALSSVVVADFMPRSGVKIQVNESETASDAASSINSGEEEISELMHALPDPDGLVGFRMVPIEFEKDVDLNLHVDFVAATANLRAINYEIAPAERHRVKQIAGKIIPAIATTTAVVAGLVGLELYKVADGCTDIGRYKNGFVNLALPFTGFSEPIPATRTRYGTAEWTLWDRFEVKGNLTLAELLEMFRRQHSIEITMLSYGSSMLFGFIRSKQVVEERMAMPMVTLVESVGKKELPPHVNSLVLEMLAEDLEGNDIEVPYILLTFRS
jgi:ubiquitin-activating enzyme E1